MNAETNVELIEDQCLQKSKDHKADDMFVNDIHVIRRLQEFELLAQFAQLNADS